MYLAETRSTLQFAQDARLIKNTLIANEVLKGKSILAYKNQINQLTAELAKMEAQKEQCEFEKIEAELREEELRNEVKTTKEKLNEALERERDRERRRRRQAIYVPGRRDEESAEARLLELEMDNNSLNQRIQDKEDAHRHLTVLLTESTEREQKAKSERERAERRVAEAEKEVEKARERVGKAEDNAARLRQKLSVAADQVVQLERRSACLEESLVECRSELQRAIDDYEVKQQLLREEMKKIRDEEDSAGHKQQLLTQGEMQKLKDEKKRLERARLEAEKAEKECNYRLAELNADMLTEQRRRRELEEELESTKNEHMELRSRFSDMQKAMNQMESQLRAKEAELRAEVKRGVEAEAETTRRVARLNQEWEKRLEDAQTAHQHLMDQQALKDEKENDDPRGPNNNNKKQKKYRDQLLELKKENDSLKKENHVLKADALRASGGAAQPRRMVTRSALRSRLD